MAQESRFCNQIEEGDELAPKGLTMRGYLKSPYRMGAGESGSSMSIFHRYST